MKRQGVLFCASFYDFAADDNVLGALRRLQKGSPHPSKSSRERVNTEVARHMYKQETPEQIWSKLF